MSAGSSSSSSSSSRPVTIQSPRHTSSITEDYVTVSPKKTDGTMTNSADSPSLVSTSVIQATVAPATMVATRTDYSSTGRAHHALISKCVSRADAWIRTFTESMIPVTPKENENAIVVEIGSGNSGVSNPLLRSGGDVKMPKIQTFKDIVEGVVARHREHQETPTTLLRLDEIQLQVNPLENKIAFDGTIPILVAPTIEPEGGWDFSVRTTQAMVDKCERLKLQHVPQIIAQTQLALAGGSMERLMTTMNPVIKDLDFFGVKIKDTDIDAQVHTLVRIMKGGPWKEDPDVRVFRTRHCVTVRSSLPNQPLTQIICRFYNSVAEVLHGFDIGACMYAWDRECGIQMTELAKLAYETRTMVLDLNMIRFSYGARLTKYFSERGYNLILPQLDATKFVSHMQVEGSKFVFNKSLCVELVQPSQFSQLGQVTNVFSGVRLTPARSCRSNELKSPDMLSKNEAKSAADEASGNLYNYASDSSILRQNLHLLQAAAQASTRAHKQKSATQLFNTLKQRAGLLCATEKYNSAKDVRTIHGYFDQLGDVLVGCIADRNNIQLVHLVSLVGSQTAHQILGDIVQIQAERLPRCMREDKFTDLERNLSELATHIVRTLVDALPTPELKSAYTALPWEYETSWRCNIKIVKPEKWYGVMLATTPHITVSAH